MAVDMRLLCGCSRWMNLPSWSSSSAAAHKFFWQQQFLQRTVMVASVPFQDGLAKLSTSWSSHRSLFRWQSWMEFSCEHTHSHLYNSRRSFVIPKSKAVAEERSSVKIHPIQCIWQNVGLLVPPLLLLKTVKRKCCSTGGNISLRKWPTSSSLHTISFPFLVDSKMILDFFPLLESNYCSYIVVVIPHFPIHFVASIALSYKQTVNGIMIRARARIQKWPGACSDISLYVCRRVYWNGSCYFAIVEWKEEEKNPTPKYMNTTRKRKFITQVATVDHRRWNWTKRRCEEEKNAANQQ